MSVPRVLKPGHRYRVVWKAKTSAELGLTERELREQSILVREILEELHCRRWMTPTTSVVAKEQMHVSKWNHEPHAGGIDIGWASSFTRKVTMLNPTYKNYFRHSYVLWFGACAASYLHVYANSLDDALEECAAYLAEYAPGHIMKHGSEEHVALLKEACEEHGVEWDPDKFCGAIEPLADMVITDAEADLTYTESGFLTSYEWGISLENPTSTDLYKFIKGD